MGGGICEELSHVSSLLLGTRLLSLCLSFHPFLPLSFPLLFLPHLPGEGGLCM